MSIASACVTLREQWLRGRPLRPQVRMVALALLGATVLVAGVIVLSPGPPAPTGQSALRRWVVVWRLAGFQPALTFGTVEWAANVLMFLPIGFFAAAAAEPRYRARLVPIAAAVSALIETAQLFVPGRVSSVSDVVANTLGTLFGVLLLVGSSDRHERPDVMTSGAGTG